MPIGDDVIGSVASVFNADRANAFGRSMMDKQFEMTKKLMQRAHQYEVEDMKKAGLNPILSAGGNGASGSAPAAPQFAQPDITMPGITDVINLGLAKRKVDNETRMVELAEKEAPLTRGKKAADTGLAAAKSRLAQKGTVKADLEGQISGVLNNMIQGFKNMYKDIQKKPNPNRPGGKGRSMDDYLNAMPNAGEFP